MKRTLPIIIITLLMMTGCRYSFELSDIGLEPRLCVRSFVCADSSVIVTVHRAIPITDAANTDTSRISPMFSLKCNGSEVEESQSDIDRGGVQYNMEAFKPGDLLELSVEEEGMKRVTASTVIPDLFPDCTTEFYKYDQWNRGALIKYEDNPETEDFYGAIVMTSTTNTETGLTWSESKRPIRGHDNLNIDYNAYSPVVTQLDGEYLFIWKDSDEEDNEYEIKYDLDGMFGKKYRKFIYLKLFKLSEEMYRTLCAWYDQDYNIFTYIGFFSPSACYTNINNGVGYFGSCSVRYTEPVEITNEF